MGKNIDMTPSKAESKPSLHESNIGQPEEKNLNPPRPSLHTTKPARKIMPRKA